MGNLIKKIYKEADKHIEDIGKNTEKLFNIAKLQLEINYISKQRDELLMNIGNTVCNMYMKDKFDEQRIHKKCKEVIDLNIEIEHLEKKMHKNKYNRKV